MKVLASDGKRRTRVVSSNEIIDALQRESAAGLKLYLEYLIFTKGESVKPLEAQTDGSPLFFTRNFFYYISTIYFLPWIWNLSENLSLLLSRTLKCILNRSPHTLISSLTDSQQKTRVPTLRHFGVLD
jgi:hypothetical protein